jgi:hypothetical protein
MSLAQQFKQVGYAEIYDTRHNVKDFDFLYACFDDFIQYVQEHPSWAQKLYAAKERFIRLKEKNYYSTDIFGFYDESQRGSRSQISFYYSIHLHQCICLCYPEVYQVSQINRFLQACYEIQQPYVDLFTQAAAELGLGNIFDSPHGHPPILFKVIKYLPSYAPTRPHYDGTVFSLFLDSTDNNSLLVSAYKSSLMAGDFAPPLRKFSRWDTPHSMLLAPGSLLADFSIYPTPHVVQKSGAIRYAAIAFAMRPDYVPPKYEFAHLPVLKIE